ncbi:MAG TPA: glycosyltransferase family 39 protein [Peptococcaceae bacterium]|nr:glycosyltransferase family 39 protein [Peptococcaceae bacterium]
MPRKEKYALFFLLFFLALIRLYHLNVPPWEIEESWRQADTESMAWNFVSYDPNPLHPNLNYDGPFPNIPALELQITTYLIAILYKLFGRHYFLARLVPLAFFLLSAGYLYFLARLYLSPRGAFFSVLLYGTLPLNIYYSRAIMPESAALMFWIAGLYYFNRWVLVRLKQEAARVESGAAAQVTALKAGVDNSATEGKAEKTLKFLIFSSVFLALALMTKPPVVFGVIPLFYLLVRSWGLKWLKFPDLWGYALATAGLPVLYYFYSISLAEYKFTLGISRDIIWREAGRAFYSPEALSFYLNSISVTLGVLGFFLLLSSFLTLTGKQAFILVWFLAMLLEVIFIVSPIRALYYLIFFTVPCALLLGNLLDRVFYKAGGKGLALFIILAMILNSFLQVKPMYSINETMATQVEVVRSVTEVDDLLVVGSLDPCLLSLADRRGWRYNLRLYSFIPENPYEELAYYLEKGAKYFVPIQGKIYGDENGELLAYIEKNYQKIEPVKGYPIYALR